MSKFDDFWEAIAPTKKEGETPPGENNKTADLETALTKANNEIEKLKKMILELNPKDEPTGTEESTGTEEPTGTEEKGDIDNE